VRESLSYKSYDVSGLKVNQYIYKNFLNNPNNLTSSDILKSSTTTFPQGSTVYIPDVTTTLDENYEILISNSISYPSFDAVPDIGKYPLTRVFGGVTIRYSNSDNYYAYVLYNGKVYRAFHQAKGYRTIYNPNNNYLYNKTAADTVANELALSCGTKIYHDSTSGCM